MYKFQTSISSSDCESIEVEYTNYINDFSFQKFFTTIHYFLCLFSKLYIENIQGNLKSRCMKTCYHIRKNNKHLIIMFILQLSFT